MNDEPKEFAFGDLNPVATRRTAPKFDPKNASVMDAIREVILGYYTPDAMAGTGPYKGIVLRVEEDMDPNEPAPGNWLATVFGEQGMFEGLTQPKILKRYKVRIPEIHVTLPVPSKYAASPQEVGGHQPIIDMYPTFVAKDSNCEQAGPGDIVWVDFGNKQNMEDPTFIGPVFPPAEGGGAAGGGGAGGAGGAGSAFGAGGAGCGGSLGASSGGRLASDTRGAVSTSDASTKWANAMYLHYKDSKARNKKDPAKVNKKFSGYGASTVKKYVERGGSGKAVSGKLALGACMKMEDELTRWLVAYRIACEDQADRGYTFGGKPVDCTVGGIDCSGFTCVVRSMAEFLCGDHDKFYELPDTPKGKNWRLWGLLTRPWYGSLKKYLIKGRHITDSDGTKWNWVEPAVVHAAGVNTGHTGKAGPAMDPDHFNDFLDRVNQSRGDSSSPLKFENGKGFDSGSNIHVPWHNIINNPSQSIQAEGQGVYIMPGDDIIIRGPKPPKWAKSHIKVSHILCTFTDPDGNLRIAESGGKHGGTGSREIAEWAEKLRQANYSIFVWQKPEWSRLWAKYGGRPNEPWTPDLLRKLAGEEYFSAPSTAAQAKGEATTNEKQTSTSSDKVENPPTSTATPEPSTSSSDSTSTADNAEVKTDAEKQAHEKKCEDEYKSLLTAAGAVPGTHPTSSDFAALTQSMAISAATSADEKNEITALGDTATGAQLATTTAGKRKLTQLDSIMTKYEACKKSFTDSSAASGSSTTSASSTAQTPAPTPPAPSGGCGSYTPGGPFTIGADRAGTALGDVPFVGHLGEIRNNPKMNLVKVDMDKTRQPKGGGHPYYATKAKVREDVAENMFEMKRILNELGCVMTSSGATRNLSAKVSPGRSATSFHYTSLAFDFTLPAMMSNPNVDEHVIEFDPEDNKQFIFWCRSHKTSGSVEKGGVTFEVEHKTLNGIKQKKGSPPQVMPVTGYWVNVTRLMRAHGMERISGRSSWYKNCSGASEAWHFDLRKNAGLEVGKTTFGQVLETVYTPAQISPHPPSASAHKTFRGGSFSDMRLKESIFRIGSSPSGIPVYKFTYRGDNSGTIYEGAMAQDILSSHPQAVFMDVSGYYKVDYNLIDVEFKVFKESYYGGE